MAKSIQMEIVKGVSANQHIELYNLVYSNDQNDPHTTVQFARWGSKQSFEAGERPLELFPPLILRGRALRLFNKQGDMKGAAWAMLDLFLTDQVPANLTAEVEMIGRDPVSKFNGAQTELDPGEQPFRLDMNVA